MATRIAVSAINLWFNRNFLSDLKPGNIFPYFCDFSGNLMSLCHRIFRKRMLSMIYMDIRTTDTYISDFYQYLIILDFWNRNLSKCNFSWICHYLL